MLVARISLMIIAVFACAGLAEATSTRPRSMAVFDEAAADDSQGPMDPVIEEPIRPVFSEGPASRQLAPAECGAMSLSMLPAAMVLMSMMRFVSCRSLRRRRGDRLN